jgi:hypothetical protein
VVSVSIALGQLSDRWGGLGNALFYTPLTAAYLDTTAESNRSLIIGDQGSAAAVGGIAGPLIVALVSSVIGARNVFVTAALLSVMAVVIGLTAVRLTRQQAGAAGGALGA